MKRYLVVYHKEDNDGAMSCALVLKYLYETGVSKDDIDILGVNYNDLANMWDRVEVQSWHKSYENLIMVDISFSDGRIMKTLYENFVGRFTWIDHHAPIINESFVKKFDNISGIRDTSRSALLNVYHYLYDPLDIAYSEHICPELLRMLSAWDSFSYEREGYTLNEVQAINIGANLMYEIDLYKHLEVLNTIMLYDGENWIATDYEKTVLKNLRNYGEVILKYEQQKNHKIVQENGDMTWTVDGRPACALFIQGQTNSIMFESVKDLVTNGIVFKRMPDGRWGFSLYNTNTSDTFHCGEYLKKNYGGGGHSGAAGAVLSETQFKKLLKTKAL